MLKAADGAMKMNWQPRFIEIYVRVKQHGFSLKENAANIARNLRGGGSLGATKDTLTEAHN